MKKWKLSAAVTVSAYTVIEAETLEEAIDISGGREVVHGGRGSGANCKEEWVVEEPDGEPFDITGEEEE